MKTPSKHEQGKSLRRTAIIKAARRIIGEKGAAGLSMRHLAEQAQVSLATPYNLFGSKQAILKALFDEDFEALKQVIQSNLDQHPLDQILMLAPQVVNFVGQQVDTERALMQLLVQQPDDLYKAAREARHEVLTALVTDIQQAGYIKAEIVPSTLGHLLGRLIFSHLQYWAHGQYSLAELESDLHLHFSLLLQQVATEEHRQWLQKPTQQALDCLSQ